MVALCGTDRERPLYFASSFFPNTLRPLSLHRFPRNFAIQCMFVGIENVPSPLYLIRCPLKEIREQKPYFGNFLDVASTFCDVIH